MTKTKTEKILEQIAQAATLAKLRAIVAELDAPTRNALTAVICQQTEKLVNARA